MEKATKKQVKTKKPVKKVKKENKPKETKVIIEANGKKYEKTFNEKGDSISIKEL